MNKKTSRPRSEKSSKTTQDLLVEMMKKPALNGGFNTLMTEVQYIKEAQGNMSDKIDGIHEAIYDPDNGLFSRLKDVEKSVQDVEQIDELSKDVVLLKQQAKHDERDSIDDEKVAETQKAAVDAHDEQLKELTKFKDRVVTVVKWIVVTFVGGCATLIGKLVYDLVVGHIKFV